MKNGNNVLVMGGIVIDKYIIVDNYPIKGQDAIITNAFDKVGGCAVNTAYTLKNLQCEPYIVSVIGSDEKGKKIYDYIQKNKLHINCIKLEKDAVTGYCFNILEKSSERTFMTYKGCEGIFYEDIIDEEIYKNTSYIYLTGYYLIYKEYRKNIIKFLKKVKKDNINILFDPGSLIGCIDREDIINILKLTDILTPNSAEIDIIEKKLSLKEDFFEWCFNMGISLITKKCGSNGVEVWTEDDHFSIPSIKIQYKDGTGSGDSFAGGLIYGLINHMDIKQTVKVASACGALTTTFIEPHGDFTIEDIKNLIE